MPEERPYVRKTKDDPQTWEVTLDHASWEDAADEAVAMRVPCPVQGYETRSACIVPRNRRGKGGRRCQLVVRFQLSNPNRRVDYRDTVVDRIIAWRKAREEARLIMEPVDRGE